MAQIHPAGWREMSVTGNAAREIETLALLDQRLADAPYSIYHGVHWTNVENGYSVYGDVDFIILAPNGRMLLIEQVAGLMNETADGLLKNFQGKPRKIRAHILHTIEGLTRRYNGELSIDYLLYCPDYTVRDPNLAGIDPRHIVDATSKGSLGRIIREALPITEKTEDFDKVTRFLGDTLSLRPDPSSMIGSATNMVTRLSGGLATWARRLEFEPFRLRVVGTAGSGKTQLALAEYQAAIDAGLRPLYVCFNRPLADHIEQLVPAGGARLHLPHAVRRLHARPGHHARLRVARGLERHRNRAVRSRAARNLAVRRPDRRRRPGFFDRLARHRARHGQAERARGLARRPRPEFIWPPDGGLPGWVKLHSDTNYRSPRQIVQMLKSIGAASESVEAGSPFKGGDIEELTYPEGDVDAMLAQTRRAVTSCLAAGFARHDIAICSFRGREKSAILNLDKLSDAHTLKSFTGAYDLFGNPVFREGGLLAESVYRFKGQSAPALIFTEIDFEEMTETVLRKLFVGMTRARLKLVLVMSDRASLQVLDRM